MCLHFVQRAKSYDCGRMSALSDVTCIHVRWTHITRWYLNNSNKQSRARMCSSWWCFCGSWYHFYSTTWTLIEHVGRPAYKAHAELTSRCGWVFSGWYVRISKCIRHLYGYISIADRNRLSFTYKKNCALSQSVKVYVRSWRIQYLGSDLISEVCVYTPLVVHHTCLSQYIRNKKYISRVRLFLL